MLYQAILPKASILISRKRVNEESHQNHHLDSMLKKFDFFLIISVFIVRIDTNPSTTIITSQGSYDQVFGFSDQYFNENFFESKQY